MTRQSMSRPRSGAGQGVSTEEPRRSLRVRQAANRSRGAPPPPPAPPKRYKQKEEGSVDDSEAEFASTELFNLTAEEVLPYYRRLYKKRANMALLFYHENNQDDHYEFTTLRLNDVYDFMDGRVSYLHMNFKAKNETSGSEKLFFAELALEGDACDKRNGGYNTITCSIVDDKCAGGQKEMLYVKDDLSPDGYDQHN
ncbi:hypothetical protein QOZ80_1AG0000700 [Eleusine coracana subsp. coracana]|nr:hypothetical protein QOZ80_1AG0000700 [Eleusine coracana subsp. coracana]